MSKHFHQLNTVKLKKEKNLLSHLHTSFPPRKKKKKKILFFRVSCLVWSGGCWWRVIGIILLKIWFSFKKILVEKFQPDLFYLLNSYQEVTCFSVLSQEHICALIISPHLATLIITGFKETREKWLYAAYCAHPVLTELVKPQACVTCNLCWKKPSLFQTF